MLKTIHIAQETANNILVFKNLLRYSILLMSFTYVRYFPEKQKNLNIKTTDLKKASNESPLIFSLLVTKFFFRS
jgi:hypothetical protein